MGCWLLEGSTGDGGSASKMAYFHRYWQEASASHWQWAKGLRSSLHGPPHKAVWVSLWHGSGFPQREWSDRKNRRKPWYLSWPSHIPSFLSYFAHLKQLTKLRGDELGPIFWWEQCSRSCDIFYTITHWYWKTERAGREYQSKPHVSTVESCCYLWRNKRALVFVASTLTLSDGYSVVVVWNL